MKYPNLTCYIIATVTVFALNSCIGSEDPYISPVKGGVELRNAIFPQNTLATDPVFLALRLNILLSTAEAENTSYDKVTIIENGYQTSLMERLFGRNNITKVDDRTWVIHYLTETNIAANDYYRVGNIRIETSGKLLGDLESGEQWNIFPEAGSYRFGIPYSASIFYYISEYSQYTMTAMDIPGYNRAWKIDNTMECYRENDTNKDLIGKWTIDFTLAANRDNMTYSSYKGTIFVQDGSAWGTAADTGFEMTYDIESPLRYKASCSSPIRIGGVERIQAPGFPAIDPEVYAQDYVKVKYRDNSSCIEYYLLTYNGYVIDTFGTLSDESF